MTDSADSIHILEDEVGRLRSVLNSIHAVMSYPHQWSASTPEAVGSILLAEGYTWPEESDHEAWGWDEPTDEQLARFRPDPVVCRCDGGECADDCCGCACHDDQEFNETTGEWEDNDAPVGD